MDLLLALAAAALIGMAVYNLLLRDLFRIVVGLLLLGQGINLAIFAAGRIVPGRAPLIAPEASTLASPVADPLPQAFLLTAIVIGLGISLFALALVAALQRQGKIDPEDLTGEGRP